MLERVIIRDFRGNYHVRIVWDSSDTRVFITDDEGIRRMLSWQYLGPIGFEPKDFFLFNKDAAMAIESGEQWDWSKLERWVRHKRIRAKRNIA